MYLSSHDDVIKWKHFLRYWPFVRGIHRSPVDSPHKGQWRGASMFFFYLCLNNRLSKQSWGWWLQTPSCSLWRHYNDFAIKKNEPKTAKLGVCDHNNLIESWRSRSIFSFYVNGMIISCEIFKYGNILPRMCVFVNAYFMINKGMNHAMQIHIFSFKIDALANDHFTNNISKYIFLRVSLHILVKIHLTHVPMSVHLTIILQCFG